MRDVVVIGAGVAGLATAAELCRLGHDVIVMEKLPHAGHRVCGEYISSEARPFLSRLGLDLEALGGPPLERLQWTTSRGSEFSAALPCGGVGLSRLRLDGELAARAEALGAKIVRGAEVKEIRFRGNHFCVTGKQPEIRARVVLGCHGKRSLLDRARPFAGRHSDYLAVKQHYEGDFPAALVSLNSFPGGYCGVSGVEGNRVNVCYLARASAVRAHGGLARFEREVLRSNRALSAWLSALRPLGQRPLAIAQVDFAKQSPVDDHVLMAGDAAQLIHPFLGNGIALALRSAKLGAHAVSMFLGGALTRPELEREYATAWHSGIRARAAFGRALHPLFELELLSDLGCKAARLLPGLAQRMLGLSHGEEF
jgi:flavin-dependent dehydrogenase